MVHDYEFLCPECGSKDVDVIEGMELAVKEIVTTNSIPIPPEKQLPNLTVLSVARLLGEVILRVHEGRSVGEVFRDYKRYE